ncbi:hypothetical protein MGYG_08295 [Nannizzia gypsea CBS 118893]|uniref:Uncharacterized protein n=1 Tax=Arthroderma gypseum (strain ATCC MYA-4604 / CBS 118893) TaxID=535722 RepID=E4V6A1_ARTGP|nr:hypothetical protein MGYG_08295 [Nannizzia gypsea CBS 118893]EFR05284.1 hypothetical protein MGYG_08295 [Nannizzia gypsea CBS 118893]
MSKIFTRSFSAARQQLARWVGYSRHSLPEEYKLAVEHYADNGAVKSMVDLEPITSMWMEPALSEWVTSASTQLPPAQDSPKRQVIASSNAIP